MNPEALEMKCPVCGKKNRPYMIAVDVGTWGEKVTANYNCAGEIGGFFKRKRPCKTTYKIIMTDEAARKAIDQLKQEGSGEP